MDGGHRSPAQQPGRPGTGACETAGGVAVLLKDHYPAYITWEQFLAPSAATDRQCERQTRGGPPWGLAPRGAPHLAAVAVG